MLILPAEERRRVTEEIIEEYAAKEIKVIQSKINQKMFSYEEKKEKYSVDIEEITEGAKKLLEDEGYKIEPNSKGGYTIYW